MMHKNNSPLSKLTKYLRVIPLALLLLVGKSLYAQEPVNQETKADFVFVVVDKQPEFPGGIKGVMNYLVENVVYPAEAVKNLIEGRVIINFVVNTDGSLSEVKVVRGIDPLLDNEAVRVISRMPNWKPGMMKDEPVRVRFTIPIVFRIPDQDKEGKDHLVIHDSDSTNSRQEKMTPSLFIIDDVRMDKNFDLKSFDCETIKTISILKADKAVAIYGEDAKDGVVIITTKEQSADKPAEAIAFDKDEDNVFVVVEKMPEFPGGIQALMSYLSNNVRYPVEAMKNGTQGRVMTNFVINEDGSISNIAIVHGVDPLLDAEAMRVIEMMPNWTPGMQKGEPVRVRFTLPVIFRLQKNEEIKKDSLH